MQDLKTRPKASQVPDVRVSTVTPSSIAMLGRLGLWTQLRPHAAEFSSMQVSSPNTDIPNTHRQTQPVL